MATPEALAKETRTPSLIQLVTGLGIAGSGSRVLQWKTVGEPFVL